MKFTEAQLELAFIELLQKQGIQYFPGNTFLRNQDEVLIKEDLKEYLQKRYKKENITSGEIEQIIRKIQAYPASDLYESNKAIMKIVSDGFILKREDRSQKDLYIQLIDYSGLAAFKDPNPEELTQVLGDVPQTYKTDLNSYKFVNQFEIYGYEKRIPDGILFINGIPLVVFEFKTAIRENTTIHDAYKQITTRYRRDIPELFKYNAFCVLSDGVNSKAGSFFAPYDFFYAWRKVTGNENDKEVNGIDAMHSLIQGMFDKNRLRDIIRNFIYIPDSSKNDQKIVCRYPQYYAANKLYDNIRKNQRPQGNGKGGTYFGATGCGKSFTMLFLKRLIMRSVEFSSPTIVIITDRTDLDD
jgi:type I restriction enzyme R subunit